jgi:hypothetical protein
MVFYPPDFFSLEPSWFAEEVHKVVPGFLRDAQESVSQVETQIEAEVSRILSGAEGEEDVWFANNLRNHEMTILEKRKGLLGAAALNYLYGSLKLKLREIASYFDKSHPRDKEYSGKSELERLTDEFRKRFNLDFETFPGGFSKVQELALARNALVHDDFGDYLAKVPQPRIIQSDGQFPVDLVEEIIGDTVQFVGWTVEELLKVRKGEVSMKGTDA